MAIKGDPRRLNPIRYERDFLVQVWIDRRKLATICSYMDANGMKPRYLSEVVKFCIDNIMNWTLAHGTQEVDKTSEASTFLEFRFGVSTNPSGKAKKNYLNNLVLDSGFSPSFEQETPMHGRVINRPIKTQEVSEEDIAELKRKSQEQFRGSDHLVEERFQKDTESLNEQQRAFEDIIKKGGNL